MKTAIYSARSIHKEYHANRVTYPVLKGVDLDVHEGEIVSIVGMSGVGKSTLLNVLGLLDLPTSGTLTFCARNTEKPLDLARLSARQRAEIRNREFGFVFQSYHLLPDLSVAENVLLPAMIQYRTARYSRMAKELRQRADSLLDMVGLSERREFSPGRLSGGERQRTAIARALMNEPRVVFCDEPTGNLDTETGEKIHAMMLDLNHRTKTAFVLVTHDLSLAGLAHRKLHMRDGLFVVDGAPETAETTETR